MIYRSHFYILSMFFLLILISCDFRSNQDKDEDLSPIYFSTWNPTSSPTSTYTPSPTPVPTKTSTPVPTNTPMPTPAPTEIPRSIGIDNLPNTESDDILGKIRDMMAGVTSYSYVVKGEAVMDAGGIPVVIPIYISGEVQDDKVSSAVEISFLGINTRMASIQSGNELYVKDFASGNWVSSTGPAIGLIPPNFWTAAGLDILSLPFDGHDAVSVKGSHGELMFSHVSNSEIPVLLALLGADKISEPFDLEDISVNIKMDIEEFKVREIEAAFSVAQGGQFASEMLGFPGLSGLGTIDIDLVAIFQNYGGEFGLQIPDR